MTDEELARKLFKEKLSLTGGYLLVADREPFVIGVTERIDVDVVMPNGSIYILRNIPCAAFRTASRDEVNAAATTYMASIGREFDSRKQPDLPFYYALSFD